MRLCMITIIHSEKKIINIPEKNGTSRFIIKQITAVFNLLMLLLFYEIHIQRRVGYQL